MTNKKSALLIVDVQEDFLEHAALVACREALIASINQLIGFAKAEHWPIVSITTVIRPDGADAMPHWRSSPLKCVAGTAGASLASDLDELGSHHYVIEKQFFSPFINPQLLDLLCGLGVSHVVVAGVHTHACVRETAVGAYSNHFEVTVIEDAVGSYDSTAASHTIEWLRNRVAAVITVKQLIESVGDNEPDFTDSEITTGKPVCLTHYAPMSLQEPLFQLHHSSGADLEQKLGAVTAAADYWSTATIERRLAVLGEWLNHLAAHREELVAALISNLGKPRRDAESEVMYGLALVQSTIESAVIHEQREDLTVHYRPHGTVLAITPWNNPFAIAVGKLAPALAFGNTVAWKPAFQATDVSNLVMACLARSGLQSHVAVFDGGADIAQQLVKNPSVSAVTFTGSVAAGESLAQLCGQLFKPFQGELGGNNGAIVWSDADPVSAAMDLAVAMFSFAGQRCTAIRRLVVADGIYSEFCDALRQAVQRLIVGDPSLDDTDCGPMVSAERVKWLRAQVAALEKRGGKLVAKSDIAPPYASHDTFFAPSVYANVQSSDPAWREEWFGPAVLVNRVQNWQEAIAAHNVTPHGLVGVIYTNKQSLVEEFTLRANVGMVSVNRARPSFSPAGPFIGWGRSAAGIPEHGRWNRDFYTKAQVRYDGR